MPTTLLSTLDTLLDHALGLHQKVDTLTIGQTCTRTVVVFLFAIVLMRLANKRFMGHSTVMDAMLGIVFGSVLSRAINGAAPFVQTLAASCVLVACHWIASALACRSHRLGYFWKGHPTLLVREGIAQVDAMRRCQITEHDLHEALRQQGEPPDIAKIALANLERNGRISIVSGH
ncbi:MAG: YetF domain-containing protein [Chthoniobacterales bacterium]